MPSLSLPAAFPFPDMVTEIAAGDTMFQGSMEGYVSVGMSALGAIEAALEGRPTPGRILDFPCGYGRITRILRARFPNAANLESAVAYQKNVMVLPTYDSARGKVFTTDFDWVSYFAAARRIITYEPLAEPEPAENAFVVAADQAWNEERISMPMSWTGPPASWRTRTKTHGHDACWRPNTRTGAREGV